SLDLRGGAAFAAAAMVLFGGYLGMFTGFSKAFAELCVLMAVAGVCAITALRRGRGLLGLGLAVGIAIALHRSALGMLPARVLAALVLPLAGVMLFVHPAQGLFRDWDDFAATGVAISLLAAWLVGETLRETRRFAWLAVAVTLGVAVAAVQWLTVHTDTVRGLHRVRAFVLEPPVRPEAQRGTTWDYLGIRSFRLERYPDAEAAFAHAAETVPSPRVLQEWALAATMAEDLRTAQVAYRRLLAKDRSNSYGWLGMLAVS